MDTIKIADEIDHHRRRLRGHDHSRCAVWDKQLCRRANHWDKSDEVAHDQAADEHIVRHNARFTSSPDGT